MTVRPAWAGLQGSGNAELAAGRGQVAGAHLFGLDVTLVDDLLDGVLRDQERLEEHGRDVTLADRVVLLVGRDLGRAGLVALGEGGGELRRGLRLLLDRL